MPRTIFSKGHQCLQQLLRSVRHEAGLSQIELARKLRYPQSFVSKYENGERRLDLIELRQLCQAMGIPLQELVKRFERAFKKLSEE